MSKEINFNFNTIFWTCVNFRRIDIYVSKLKSRIYKAFREKSFQKLLFLQLQFSESIAVRYFASEILFLENKYLLDIYQDSEYVICMEKKIFLDLQMNI